MKKHLLQVALLALCLTSIKAQNSVIISEICDPKNSYQTDRFIEIYNAGGAAVNITGWKLVAIGNGGEIFTWELSGSMEPGKALVAGNATTVSTFTVDFADAGWNSNNGTWNGGNDDGAKLIDNGGTVVDYAVGMSFKDNDMVRKAEINLPSATFNAAEWTTAACNNAAEASPGTHDGSTVTVDPLITQIKITPVSPSHSDSVSVSSTITTSSESIVSVVLFWWTNADTAKRNIPMQGSTSNYITIQYIPVQTQGTTVYYQIRAENSEQKSALSALKNYTIPVILPDVTPPTISGAQVLDSVTMLVSFSEKINEGTANTETNYIIDGNSSLSAQIENNEKQVKLSTNQLEYGEHELIVKNISDLEGNAITSDTFYFSFLTGDIPEGYYATATGLVGTPLRQALHDIIDGHTAKSYDYAWTGYRTTDVKPNGKVWDIYSDIPGGTPPYEYEFGVNEGGAGGSEGKGYTREHSFPKSWFGGEVMPMYSDLFALYPCDAHVNGTRGNDPYGEVDSPDITTQNGSKKGDCSYPGYTGKVFEPIDAYKGDLARTYFYMITRYFGEDASWPGSPMTEGANLRPWALQMMIEWHFADPVSEKEIIRNEAIYAIQNNRNPFIDHPEWVNSIWVDSISTGIADDVLYSDIASAYVDNGVLYFDGKNVRQLQVYSISGNLLYQANSLQPINVSLWNSGIYIVRFVGGDAVGENTVCVRKIFIGR